MLIVERFCRLGSESGAKTGEGPVCKRLIYAGEL